MNENLQPLGDDHLEARITAYVLGESSPFEAAELESLIEKSPELKLFLNRTRTLHTLLAEAETTSNSSSEEWKLPSEKREKLNTILGSTVVSTPPVSSFQRESRIRRASFRASFRAAIGIAACFVVTFIISRLYVFPKAMKESAMTISYMASEDDTVVQAEHEPAVSVLQATEGSRDDLATLKLAVREQEDKVEEARKTLTTISRSKGISYYGDSSVASRGELDEDTESSAALAKNEAKKSALERSIAPQDYVDAKRDLDTDQAVLDQLKLKLITEEIAANLPEEKIQLADNRRDSDSRQKKPQAPSSSMEGKITAANTISPIAIPVPEIALAGLSQNFGNGDDFGDDFGFGAGGGGGAAPPPPEAPSFAAVKSGQADADPFVDNTSGGELAARSSRNGDAAISRDSIDGSLDGKERPGARPQAEASLPAPSAKPSAPSDERIKAELGYLDDPIRTNPALTYEHQKSVDEVRRNLYMANGNLELGKYDAAKKNYEDTLRVDPYNSAARRGMEKIQTAKSDYYRAAHDNTRTELLMEGGNARELDIPADERSAVFGPPPEAKAPQQAGQDARAELLAEVDKAWELSVPADPANGKKGEANGQADPFAESASPGEIGSLTGLFSEGIDSDFKIAADSNSRFGMNLRGGAERSDLSLDREFEGFLNYGAPIVGESDPFFDTSGAVAKADGSRGNTEYEIHTGYTSEYLFRGLDLNKEKESPPAIDLADLSQEIPANQEPFSTFSLNISDASFQIARTAVEKGERPDPESIKPEQFYNAVDYGDPAPSSLEPIAAAIDQTAHPVIPGRNLVRVGIRTASTGRSAGQPLRLTLLVDQSGSMVRNDRRAAMEKALEQLATLLTENDEVTVIGFSRTPRLLADSMKGNEAGKLPALINQTANEGGTNIEQAMNLASDLALRHKLDGAQNRIVLFTDGAANLGNADPDHLADKVKDLRQQGLAFDIAGIGTNELNDKLLSELARHGNGRYYLVGENTGASLATQLAGAFRPAAENVKVQVKLNPERVGSYKLIGFEKDRLKTEDFRNDSVDAAELAADEAGVAMYQVETLPEGSGEIGEVSVRFRDTASGEMVERTWTIPYDATAPAFDKAAPKTQLATLSLLAAQKLQGGPLADAISFGNLAKTIAELRQTYKADAKAQQMLNLINALK